MIDRIERGSSSPTALVLGKLSAALGLTISTLLSPRNDAPVRLVREEERAMWTDPSTGYRRRQVVAAPAYPVDVTEVVLPPGASVAYPAGSYSFTRHLIWVLDGALTFREGDAVHQLAAGDRLILRGAADCEYRNESDRDCRYCVVVAPM
ncbi:MAG: LacI family transcriptional regulator [Microbacterium sp.]|jgi:transcriptional regulator with XRE-family HTH domain|nr:LacI family transcriptional regulator [Microbacterium sp.]